MKKAFKVLVWDKEYYASSAMELKNTLLDELKKVDEQLKPLGKFDVEGKQFELIRQLTLEKKEMIKTFDDRIKLARQAQKILKKRTALSETIELMGFGNTDEQ
jgi:hypothetical protein